MRSKKTGTDALMSAAYAAGFSMAPIDEAGADLPREAADPIEQESTSTAVVVAQPSARNVLASSAGQVTGWIRQRVPLLGRGIPA